MKVLSSQACVIFHWAVDVPQYRFLPVFLATIRVASTFIYGKPAISFRSRAKFRWNAVARCAVY